MATPRQPERALGRARTSGMHLAMTRRHSRQLGGPPLPARRASGRAVGGGDDAPSLPLEPELA